MRYYVTADVHGFYTLMTDALERAGFFTDAEPHKLIILGDLFDRGNEALSMQRFVLEQMDKGEIILVKGNHEDLFSDLVTIDNGLPYSHHISNGTYDTAFQLTGIGSLEEWKDCEDLAEKGRKTPYYTRIIPAMRDCYETEHYVFVHGWIPCRKNADGSISPRPDWRDASGQDWYDARWINGMDAARTETEGKTILCGHWHTSYGHSRYEGKGTEFGPDADFSPYYGPNIIAMDACTAYSGTVNCIVIED